MVYSKEEGSRGLISRDNDGEARLGKESETKRQM